MIPKKIHYCWFGGNPLPELALKCIESWKKYCPDYEIIEWSENNFDINCCDYIKEAYEAKKWAFVSDYARFKILYEHGGLYFDTDVEVIQPLDELIARGNFMGNESDTKLAINPGLGVAVEKKCPLYKELLESYSTRHFRNTDGTLNEKTVVDYTTEILVQHGLKNKNTIQLVAGVYIYPKEYFCPMDYTTAEIKLTQSTFSIHHYTASWYDNKQKYALDIKRKIGRILPRRVAGICATAIAITKYEGLHSCIKWIFKKRR